MKEKIEKFKEERIGSKRRDFVETVQTEQPKPDDLVAEDVMDTTEG
jgi:hypothetical protein